MAVRVQVESGQWRSGAGKMRGFAAAATRRPPDVERSAKQADGANKGFMTGEACEAVAEDFQEDMKDLNEHLEDTAEILGEIADDWDEADGANAEVFQSVGSEVSSLKPPGV